MPYPRPDADRRLPPPPRPTEESCDTVACPLLHCSLPLLIAIIMIFGCDGRKTAQPSPEDSVRLYIRDAGSVAISRGGVLFLGSGKSRRRVDADTVAAVWEHADALAKQGAAGTYSISSEMADPDWAGFRVVVSSRGKRSEFLLTCEEKHTEAPGELLVIVSHLSGWTPW